ncbi:hypothetical protein G6F50_014302 [Rhizopus delemar]|uniref:Uncharacterized protein n=1 Tax=Rhizopus delemar TaxID=936053 RepID=A0A9P6Y6X0_9FUNG|nr:hypothetical protein G6F50_014302 [Rhizopus delemar]
MKGETVARVALWLLWSLWALACIVLLLGAAANYLASRTQTLPLVLQPGATAEITVYRFIDDPLRLRLRYADDGLEPSIDPEVRLRAETPTDRNEFRADTRSASATADVIRALESVEPDRFAASYFGYGRGDALPRGRSWLRLTVLAVDPALAGRAATLAILLEGRVFGAEEAQGLGLLTRIVADDQVAEAPRRSADRIAQGAPLAARINKRLSARLAQGGALTEDEYQDYFSYAESRDHKEGVRAFLAGVDPSFSGD